MQFFYMYIADWIFVCLELSIVNSSLSSSIRSWCNIISYCWQIWVKIPEVLARDRVRSSFSVSCHYWLLKYPILLLWVSFVLYFQIQDQLYAIKLRKSILVHAHGMSCEIFRRYDRIMNHALDLHLWVLSGTVLLWNIWNCCAKKKTQHHSIIAKNLLHAC